MWNLFFKNNGYFSNLVCRSEKALEKLCDTFHFYFSI